MNATATSRSPLAQRWDALAPRERAMVAVMCGALAFLAVWLVAVRPAWRSLEQAPVLRAQADEQLLQMQALSAEAKELRGLPPVQPGQAEQALKAATGQLGSKGKLAMQGDHATLTLNGATGEDLRQWLIQVRGGARARPIEATLTRAGQGYNGTIVVSLGGAQ